MNQNKIKAAEIEEEYSKEQCEESTTDQPGNQTDNRIEKEPRCNPHYFDLSTFLIINDCTIS